MAAENKVPNRQSKSVKTSSTSSSKRVTTPAAPKKASAKASPSTVNAAIKKVSAATVSAAAAVVRRRTTRKPIEAKLITPEERLRYIETAAYYIAEKRGFAGGDPAQDWNMAEQQVDSQLMAGQLPA